MLSSFENFNRSASYILFLEYLGLYGILIYLVYTVSLYCHIQPHIHTFGNILNQFDKPGTVWNSEGCGLLDLLTSRSLSLYLPEISRFTISDKYWFIFYKKNIGFVRLQYIVSTYIILSYTLLWLAVGTAREVS